MLTDSTPFTVPCTTIFSPFSASIAPTTVATKPPTRADTSSWRSACSSSTFLTRNRLGSYVMSPAKWRTTNSVWPYRGLVKCMFWFRCFS